MAQGPGDPTDDVDAGASPEQIRARMAQTRAELGRKLDALGGRFAGPRGAAITGTRKAMPPKKSVKTTTTAAGAKPAAEKRTAKAAPAKAPAAKPAAPAAASKPAPKRAAAKSARAPKASKSAATKSATRKRPAAATGIAGKATELLGEMLAGAAVGAVTGAAGQVRQEPGAVAEPEVNQVAAGGTGKAGVRKKGTPKRAAAAASKPSEMLGEMAAGAAIGAVTGAAKAVLPEEPAPRKRSAKKT